jgi:DNA repair protein RadC
MAHRDLKNIEIVKVRLVKDISNAYRIKQINKQETAASVAKEFLANEDREVFIAINLDGSMRINSINIVSVGCLDHTVVHPREVFKTTILSNASDVIIAHNHPSGNPDPSEHDIEITRRLFECGKLLDIKVLDHIIIGDDEYTSVRLEGSDIIWERKKFKDELKEKGISFAKESKRALANR